MPLLDLSAARVLGLADGSLVYVGPLVEGVSLQARRLASGDWVVGRAPEGSVVGPAVGCAGGRHVRVSDEGRARGGLLPRE